MLSTCQREMRIGHKLFSRYLSCHRQSTQTIVCLQIISIGTDGVATFSAHKYLCFDETSLTLKTEKIVVNQLKLVHIEIFVDFKSCRNVWRDRTSNALIDLEIFQFLNRTDANLNHMNSLERISNDHRDRAYLWDCRQVTIRRGISDQTAATHSRKVPNISQLTTSSARLRRSSGNTPKL